MKFQKIRNLGGKFGITVREVFGVETVQELLCVSPPFFVGVRTDVDRCRAFPLVDLQKKLGADSGTFVYEVVRGLDFTEGTTRASAELCR